jgi:hypothetical protein
MSLKYYIIVVAIESYPLKYDEYNRVHDKGQVNKDADDDDNNNSNNNGDNIHDDIVHVIIML